MAVAYMTERKAGLAVVDSHDPLPRLVGCMTDAAGDIEFYLGDIDYPAHVTRFLRKMAYFSFKQAGFYRQRKYPNPGGWCFFTAEKWATLLRMDKSQVFHIRKRLVDDGIIFYQPNLTGERDLEGDVADGRLIWNLTFAEWKPLQGEPTPYNYGGTRQGAGRPRKKQVANANLNTGQASTDNLNTTDDQQGSNANLISGSHTSPLQDQDEPSQTQRGQEEICDAPALAISKISSLHCTPGYFALDACPEASADKTPGVAVINASLKEEKTEEEETYMVADATQASFFPEVEPAAPKAKEKPVPSKPKRSTKKQSKTEALLERRPELRPLHEMAIKLFGRPMGLPALDWANYLEELGDRPVTAEQLEAASRWYRKKYPRMNHSLQAVTGHYHEYEQTLTQAQEGANHAGRTEQAKRGDTSDQAYHTEIDKWGVVSIYSTPRSPA